MSLRMLNLEDAANLEHKNLIGPVRQGRRQVSTSLFSSEASVTSLDSALGDAQTVIPEFFNSCETLTYVGFTEAKSTEIFTAWQQALHTIPEYEMDFVEFSLNGVSPLNSQQDAFDINDDWFGLMNQMGVGTILQERIMTPAFEKIRLSESCRYWVHYSIELSFELLMLVHKNSESRTSNKASLQQASSETSLLASQQQNYPSTQLSIPSSGQSSSPTGQPQVAISNQPMSTAPGNTVLYKGIEPCRIRYDDNGKILFESLESPAPTDFRGRGGLCIYFASQLATAKICAKFKVHLVPEGQPVILQMTIANAHIEDLQPHILKFSQLWKRIIWSCSNRMIFKNDLKFFNNLKLIIGPICGKANIAIQNMEKWEDITEEHQMSIPSLSNPSRDVPAIQFVFQGPETVELLQAMATTYIMWKSHQHDEQFRPKAAAYRNTKSEEAGSMDLPNSNNGAITGAYVDAASAADGNVGVPEAQDIEPANREHTLYAGT